MYIYSKSADPSGYEVFICCHQTAFLDGVEFCCFPGKCFIVFHSEALLRKEDHMVVAKREREREHERTLREQKITKDSVSRGKTPPRVSPFGGVRCIFGHVRDVSNGLFNGCASCTPSLVESAARPLRTSAVSYTHLTLPTKLEV